jgi:2-keto-4-pentenoate hydratase
MVLDPAAAASEILVARARAELISPFASRGAAFDMAAAHAVARELRGLRAAQGETPVGRKIGFTNRNIWAEYSVFAPIWGEVYDTTLVEVVPGSAVTISHLSQPRIEPEIVLGLDRDLVPGMSIEAVEDSIAWVAHGFEIVQTVFPDWRFTGADCMAEGGLHGALAVGPRRPVDATQRRGLASRLSALRVELFRNGALVDSGAGSNVLDGPIHALKYLADSFGDLPSAEPMRLGEAVTTGTLTRAFPVAPGESWSTIMTGFELPGLQVRLV